MSMLLWCIHIEPFYTNGPKYIEYSMLKTKLNKYCMVPASWSSGNKFVAGGLRFKSRVGQIGHRVAYGLSLL